MMTIDKTIDPWELDLCKVYAVKFGYPRENSSEIISTIQTHITMKAARSETFQAVENLLW